MNQSAFTIETIVQKEFFDDESPTSQSPSQLRRILKDALAKTKLKPEYVRMACQSAARQDLKFTFPEWEDYVTNFLNDLETK